MKKIQAVLVCLLMMFQLSANQQTKQKTNSDKGFEIDLTKTYSGYQVQQLLNIVLEEADIAIDKATEKGYLIAAEERDALQKKYDHEKKYRWLYVAGGVLLGGLIVGGVVWLTK